MYMDAVGRIGNILFPWTYSPSAFGSEPVSWNCQTPKSRGAREPDFATLMRICAVLDVTPNDLLLADAQSRRSAHDRWLSRLVAAGRKLDTDGVKLAVRQVEALIEHRNLQKTR